MVHVNDQQTPDLGTPFCQPNVRLGSHTGVCGNCGRWFSEGERALCLSRSHECLETDCSGGFNCVGVICASCAQHPEFDRWLWWPRAE